MKSTSIVNDVIGPIMTGPSSSHTAGPARIGNLARQIAGTPKHVTIKFSRSGSVAATYKGQGSDFGFVGGLLGHLPSDMEIVNSLEAAKSKGMEVVFELTDEFFPHPNTCHLTIMNSDKEETVIIGESIGGGIVNISMINGFETELKGDNYSCLIWTDSDYAKKLMEMEIIKDYDITISYNANERLLLLKSFKPFPDVFKKFVSEQKDIIKFNFIEPVLPFSVQDKEAKFRTASEMKSAMKEKNFTLSEAALEYEMSKTGLTEMQIKSYMNTVLSTMEKSYSDGMNLKGSRGFRYSKPAASKMKQAMEAGKFMDTGLLNEGILMTTAIMENNKSFGCIVAAPTAGSAGVVPAAILLLKEQYNLSDDDCINGLLAAGITGAFVENSASFTAEDGGCQAENGTASAMAAAAAMTLLGYDSDMALKAAALSLQNMLGVICDPVAGSVEIPCINRNAMALANALTACNMIIGGFDPIIPFDQVVLAMKNVSDKMCKDFKCNGKGGLCSTRKAREIVLNTEY